MDVPLEDYACEDYLAVAYRDGLFDELAQWWLITPTSKAYERGAFLVIGSPGVDGIEWGYRRGRGGIWMYEPIVDEFSYLAPSLPEYLRGWETGTISV